MSKLRVRHGEYEIEVEGSDQFIKRQLADFYQKVASQPSAPRAGGVKQEILKPVSKSQRSPHMTPAEFYTAKGKTDGISKILIFGKYLEEFKGISEFSMKDINKLAKKARLSKDIHRQYLTNAVKQGLLRSHGRGQYSLTLSAESLLSAM